MKFIAHKFAALLIFFSIIVIITACPPSLRASDNGWAVTPGQKKAFIENKGQWSGRNNLPGSNVLFATDYGNAQFLFTPNGLTYRLEKKEVYLRDKEEEREKVVRKAGIISHQEREDYVAERGLRIEVDFVQMQWVGANPNAEVVALDKVAHYFNYSIGNKGFDHANGFEKLIYKNLYPNIDVEYVFHPKGGIEYSLILHPGADASKVKMKYSDVGAISLNGDKNLRLRTKLGDIIEHAPQTFYEEVGGKPISSRFVCNGKTVSFALGNYDNTKKVIIDPWVQTPAFNTQWDCVWECEKDGAGNVYIIGGVMAMELRKYNAAGVLQWTHVTPYDTSNKWLGTFATDDAGNSYVTAGSLAAIQKINTNGGLVWNNGAPGGLFSSTEFWTISFNCDQTKLVIGGTGGLLQPYIYEVDMNSGNTNQGIALTGGGIGGFLKVQEVRSITACGNGKYYFLTHDSIGYLMQNFSVCVKDPDAIYFTDNGYGLGYKCEDFRIDNSGICAIRTYGGFVYVNRGNRLDKRNFATGALIASVAIPGGAFNTSGFGNSVGNSGIDIDVSGNIYVGSKNQVVKFDQSLAQLATYPTSFNVYDVHVSTNGDIIACGSTGNSSSGTRTGYIQQIAANAAAPVVIVCCDATICEAGPFCTSDAPYTLIPGAAGGTWSGPGITNTSTGQFSPAVAGQGTHYVVNTKLCGSDSIPIKVNLCTALLPCREQNGSVTVSSGTPVYTWYKQDSVQNCTACIITCIFPPGCAVPGVTWTQFATGSNVTPPSYPIRIIDASGNEIIIPSAASLSPCSTTACNLTASATSVGSTCGNNNGSATAAQANGTAPYSYLWSNNGVTQTINSLAAGNYAVTVTDGGSCTASASVSVASSNTLSVSSSTTNATCGNNNGTATVAVSGGGSFTYLWSNNGNGATIGNLAAGTYTVTVTGAGNCSATSSATVIATAGITLTPTSTNATCGNNNGTATVTPSGAGSFTYLWGNNGNTPTITGLAPGVYNVTVSQSGCSATASVVVSPSTGLVATFSVTQPSCGVANGILNNTGIVGGTQPITLEWKLNNTVVGTTAQISSLGAGVYTFHAADANNCTIDTSFELLPGGVGNVTIQAPPAPLCSGDSAQICAPTGYAAYQWNTGDTGRCVQAKLAGNYWVTVTDNGNCTAASNHVAVGFYPLPPVSITVNGDTLTAFNAVTYQWYFNGTAIQGATSAVYVATQTGNYTLDITDANGCHALSNPINIVITGVDRLAVNGMRIYPNPSVLKHWSLEVSKDFIGSGIEVFDVRGRIVHKAEIRELKSLISFDAEQGVYMLQIYKGDLTIIERLTKL